MDEDLRFGKFIIFYNVINIIYYERIGFAFAVCVLESWSWL